MKDRYGPLNHHSYEPSDPGSIEALRGHMAIDGYLHLKGLIDLDAVESGRRFILETLAEVGEIAEPVEAAIPTGASRRRELKGHCGPFWQAVSNDPRIRRVTHGPELHGFMSAFFGEPAHAYDFIWLRTVPPGQSFDLHCDYPFFDQTRGKIYSTWIPFCDVPRELGPLFMFEGTSNNPALVQRALETPNVYPPVEDRLSFAEAYDTTMLTGNIEAGDVIVFPMFTWHGSFDNESADGRIRISCDTRYLPQSEPRDPAWNGAAPAGRDCGDIPGGSYGAPGQWFSLSDD